MLNLEIFSISHMNVYIQLNHIEVYNNEPR